MSLGLLYAGKGVLTLSQFRQGDFLFNKEGTCGLLILSIMLTNVDEFIINKNHYMLSYLGLSFSHKYLFIVDEHLNDV